MTNEGINDGRRTNLHDIFDQTTRPTTVWWDADSRRKYVLKGFVPEQIWLEGRQRSGIWLIKPAGSPLRDCVRTDVLSRLTDCFWFLSVYKRRKEVALMESVRPDVIPSNERHKRTAMWVHTAVTQLDSITLPGHREAPFKCPWKKWNRKPQLQPASNTRHPPDINTPGSGLIDTTPDKQAAFQQDDCCTDKHHFAPSVMAAGGGSDRDEWTILWGGAPGQKWAAVKSAQDKRIHSTHSSAQTSPELYQLWPQLLTWQRHEGKVPHKHQRQAKCLDCITNTVSEEAQRSMVINKPSNHLSGGTFQRTVGTNTETDIMNWN